MGNKTTIEFNDAAARKLEQMTEVLGAASKAEVIRNALALYDFIVRELGGPDRHLAIIEGEQIKKVIAVPGIPSYVLH